MLSNLTILFLHLTGLSSKSALFSPASYSQRSYYNFQNLYLSKHFSTFLDISTVKITSQIANSKFNSFLNSVIRIHQESFVSFYGVSDQTNNPITPMVSFQCNSTSFTHNTSPFNGAAILVHSNINSINTITGIIGDSEFYNNTALMGGAIYFESNIFNIENSRFKSNTAAIGAHLFSSCSQSSNISNTNFQESSEGQSSLELTSSNIMDYNFQYCKFFLDKSPLRVNSKGVTVNLEECCFMFYEGDKYKGYRYENLISAPKGKIELSNVIANERKGNANFTDNETIDLEHCALNKAEDEDIGAPCRLIPSPTMTSDYKISDEPAIFALVAIIFFVLVSIIGIFIVTCRKKKDEPIEQEMEEPLNAK